jgi:hypothetical protein
MTKAPLAVETRPFAIEPVTRVMLPDGIFDNALYNLEIACHYTNQSGSDLTNVTIYLEGASDPGITITGRTFHFPVVKAGASVLLQWAANFQHASPGKPNISFIATADGFESARSIRQIFVSQTRYDTVQHHWTCEIPEGRMTVNTLYAYKPGPGREIGGKGGGKLPGPRAISGVDFAWSPNPGFEGQHGDLPFSDPWWKVIAIIVAAIAALVGIIAEAVGSGTFSPGVSGTFEEDPNNPSVSCCSPNPGGSIKNDATTVAGVCGVICSVAIAVACSDEADPVWRGEENTNPVAGEITTGETVHATWSFAEAPNAGVPYETKVDWKYNRQTSGNDYSYSVSETKVNEHVLEDIVVETPHAVHADKDPLWAHAIFRKPGGVEYTGAELYTFCFFKSPGTHGLYFIVPLLDDGNAPDVDANDGTYSAGLSWKEVDAALREANLPTKGRWSVYVYAQEVNRTEPGTEPVLAAQTIGGQFVASAVSLTFDPNLPCPLKAQRTFVVE